MHILLALLVAAVLFAWWARGGLIPALMATMIGVVLIVLGATDQSLTSAIVGLSVSIFAWSPIYIYNQQSRVTVLAPIAAVRLYPR